MQAKRKLRRLTIDPALLVTWLQGHEAIRFTKNRLPEDARLKRVEIDEYHSVCPDSGVARSVRFTISLWISSAVFSDEDPTDLEAVHCEPVSVPPTVEMPPNPTDLYTKATIAIGTGIDSSKPVKFREFT